MNQTTIVSLAIIGAVVIIVTFAINEVTEMLKGNQETAWFILGFGVCMLLESAIWGIAKLYKRFFP